MTATICVFEGDDAASEVVEPTVQILRDLGLDLDFVHPEVDGIITDPDARSVPESIQSAIDGADSVLFGSASTTHRPIIWYLRNEYRDGLPANVRPVKYYTGANSPLSDPDDIDYVIVRENLEGLYFRTEGPLDELIDSGLDLSRGTRSVQTSDRGRYAIRLMTEENLAWLAEFACELATDRTPSDPLITCATKSNVLTETDGLFDRIIESVVHDHGIEYEHLHVDDIGQQLVVNPDRFDVIVMPNFAGDILSDVGAGTIGGLGLAPSGCYGDDGAYFEPVHGTAPDIAGQNIINPTAMILSAVMMLDFLGHAREAERLERAVSAVYAEGTTLTPDQGGTASTTDMVAAIVEHL